MSRERRRAERISSRMFVELRPRSVLDDFKGRGVVVDVSHLGLAVETEAELDMNTVYDCHVELPFALKARVVRRYKTGQLNRYGLEIVGQGFLDQFLLKRILKKSTATRKV